MSVTLSPGDEAPSCIVESLHRGCGDLWSGMCAQLETGNYPSAGALYRYKVQLDH
jgi:hypothetical protein